jgi:hypothetical protein
MAEGPADNRDDLAELMGRGVRRLPRLDLLWRALWRRHRIKGVRRVASINDLPRRLGGELYIVGSSKPKWAVLACPCACRERIDVNLMSSRCPFWTLSGTDDALTLSPSLWMPDTKCGSHFFVRQGKIEWV